MLSKFRVLDVTTETEAGTRLREEVSSRVVGQTAGVNFFVGQMEKFYGNLYDDKKPISSALFIGPTGSGKTHSTEVFAEALQESSPIFMRESKVNMLKIDCGEFQHGHEIAKLIGSPPGYLGHRETPALLSNVRIKALQGITRHPFGILLFDEIEKASDTLWHLLLSVLDKGKITLGTNEEVDLRHMMIFMTSNAGTAEMSVALGDRLGFQGGTSMGPEDHDPKEVARIGQAAAKKKFTNEFINRLDAVIAFNALTKEDARKVLEIELAKLQFEVFTKCAAKFLFSIQTTAIEQLLKDGYSKKYNARHLKREIDKQLRLPFARVSSRKDIGETEVLVVEFKDDKYQFKAMARNDHKFVIHGGLVA